jgi:biotin transport system substrate-specific component
MLMLLITSSRLQHKGLAQLMGVVLFALFVALSARITLYLPFTPVPITLQVLAVLLAGLVLGPRAGAASQIAYLAAIAAGLPLDSRALGLAALTGPTAGYLIGFVPAAFVTGWLAERLSSTWTGRFLAALGGVAVIYLAGVAWLSAGVGSLSTAWMRGVAPFIVFDLVKALVAAAVTESGRLLFKH